MKDIAIEYLSRDRLYHIDMLETLYRGIGELIYADERGAAVLNSGYTYMISTQSEETLKKICAKLERPPVIEMHQAQLVPWLQAKYGYRHTMECLQCAYLSKERLDEKLTEGLSLHELTMAELGFVYKNYDHPSDERYLAERIKAGMIGAFSGNELAGFVGTHDEGTMGILQVLPEFRRRGIAYSLEAAMINRQLELGYVPHAHIVTTNKASILLQKKLGLSVSDKTVTWLYDE